MMHRIIKPAVIILLCLLVSLIVIPKSVSASQNLAERSQIIAQFKGLNDQTALESVVTFSGNNAQGAGYIPGETVHVDVRGPNGEVYGCDAKVDQSGAWSCSVNLWKDKPITGTFYYKATGLKSGVSYTGSFTNSGAVKSVKLIVEGKELADKAVIHPGTNVDARIELESTRRDFAWSATKYQIQQKACSSDTDCTWKTVYTSPCLSAPEPNLIGEQPALYVTLANVFKQTQANNFYQLMATTFSDTACRLVNGEQWYYADEFELKNYSTSTNLVCSPAENSFGNKFDCQATVTRTPAKPDGPKGTVTFEIEGSHPDAAVPVQCILKANPDGSASCSTVFQSTNNGEYQVRASFASSDPSDESSISSWQKVAFELQTPVVTVTADPVTKTYGDADPVLMYTTSPKNLYGIFSGTLTRTPGEDAGSYTISQGSLKAQGYTIKFVPSSLLIEKARANLQAIGFTGAYDGQPHGVTGTATGVKGEDLSALLTFGPSFTNVPGGASSISFAGNQNYLAGSIQKVPVTINPRELEVSADVLSKVYGNPDPTFTYKITGGSLEAGDKISGTISREPVENAGLQMLTRGTLSAGANYHLSFISAWFKINKRPITITADPQSKLVGGAEPAFTFIITSGSLVNGDMFSGTPGRTPGEIAGVYPIGQGSLYLSENYELTFVGSTFTIYEAAAGLDTDADGILNVSDNCVFSSNKDQKDSDQDGFGDTCDTTPLNLQANMVVPVTGSANSIPLNCAGITSLALGDGSFVNLPKELCKDKVVFGNEPAASLPAVLPSPAKFISAINLVLLENQNLVSVTQNNEPLVYAFKIPTSAANAKLQLYYWKADAQSSLGTWIELPSCPVRSSMMIDKTDAADKRVFLTCTQTADYKKITFSTNFPGLFVLAAH